MGIYSPVRGRMKNNEEVLQEGVTSRVASKEEIEAMLADRWPGKVAPITGVRHKTPPRNSDLPNLAFGKNLRR